MLKFFYSLFISISLLLATGAMAQDNIRSVIGNMLKNGQYEQAVDYLKQNGGSQDDLDLLNADIDLAKGNFAKAIRTYRALVAKHPDNLGLRRKLVQILISNKNFESARYHLEELLKRDKNPLAQQIYTKQLATLSDYQKFGASGTFGLSPSNNINHASSQETESFLGYEYNIPSELLPQFGWRATVGLSAYARKRIADNQELILRLNASTTQYTVPTLDQTYADLSLNWVYQSARETVSIAPFYSRQYGDGEAYQIANIFGDPVAQIVERNENSSIYGVRFYLEQRYKKAKTFFITGQYAHQVYDDKDRLSYAENDQTSLRLGYSFLPNSRTRLAIWTGAFSRVELGGRENYVSANNYFGALVGASVETFARSGLRVKASFEHNVKEYELPPYFSFSSKDRIDTSNTLGLELSHQKWTIGKFLPLLSCQYAITQSNFDQYDNNGATCGITLSQSF